MRPGSGTFALILHALAWSLYLTALILAGLDPTPLAFILVIVAHLAAVSGMLTGILGLLRRQQAKRCAFAITLGLLWIATITGLFGRSVF